MSGEKPIRFGVAGCGTVAGYGHIPAIASLGDLGVSLEALCDINVEAAKKQAEKYGVKRVYADWREMVAEGGLDAVAIATHIDTHHPITMAGLEAGLHVLCEKPLSDTVERAGEMHSAALAANLRLGVGFILRTADYINVIRDALSRGAIGRPRAIRDLDAWGGPDWRGAKPGRKAGFMAEGGPMFGEAIHHWDLVYYLTGIRVKTIETFGVNLEDYEWPDHTLAVATLEDGTMFVHESSWGFAYNVKTKAANEESIVIMGDRGAIRWSEITRKVEIICDDSPQEIEVGREKDFPMLYRGFVEWIRTGEKPDFVAGGLDGLEAQKATEIAMKSLAGRMSLNTRR